MENTQPMVAFVLSGGAALGAAQVGMLRALLEHGIRPDLIVGTSIGAWNGLWLATHPALRDLDELERLWKTMSTARLFGHGAFHLVRHLPRWPNYVLPSSSLARWFTHVFPGRDLDAVTFADVAIPLKVCATNIMRGVSEIFDHGPLILPVLASSAIPGLFAPVVIDGQQYVDGGIIDNGGISVAIASGATEIYVLSVAYGGELPQPITSWFGLIDRCFHLIASRHVSQAVEQFARQVRFVIIEDEQIGQGSLLSFRHTNQLIAAGYQAAVRALVQASPSEDVSADE